MHRRLAMITFAAVLFSVVVACGGDDDGGDPGGQGPTATPFGNDAAGEPVLEMPVSRFSIAQPDLGTGYITDIEDTYDLAADDGDGRYSYASTKTFTSPDEGRRLLKQWGYLGGYETGYTPEGYSRAVLEGAYYIKVETHLFEDAAGAHEAYGYFHDRLQQSTSEPVSVEAIGNEASGWRLVREKVSGTSVDGEFHQYLFRRGNLVAVVLTWGAEPFMNINTVYGLAHIIDAKAMGQVEAIEPTPVSLANAGS
jgi:hypothetical protein